MNAANELTGASLGQGGGATSAGADDEATRVISGPRTSADALSQQPTLARPASAQGASEWHNPVTATQVMPSGPGSGAASNANAGLLPIGTKLAEFEITGLIGQGGFGVVYRAWDHALEREVAIKEYMPSSLANRQSDGRVVPLSERHQETFDAGMRSFINEARLLAQFDDPSLLKVYRFWQEHGTTYMVMPLYKGQTLKAALAGMSAPEREQTAELLRRIRKDRSIIIIEHDMELVRDLCNPVVVMAEGRTLVLVPNAAQKALEQG